ncbi:MAG TPA: hypothetical protein VLJ88_00130 [Propionibacteriaceae bacterium]|nr:hypothetical protein [Propionibacteriaceae bacterium]
MKDPTSFGLPEHWNTTHEEVEAVYPCDEFSEAPYRSLTRAVDVEAPPALVFRWLCQLRAAPYSYDLIDNWGRRSPRELTPGLDELAVGQFLLVATVASFVRDEHITGRSTPAASRLFGLMALTYQVNPRGAGSRLIGRLNVQPPRGVWAQTRYTLLAWGDVIMMRKQLLTFKALAERDARRGADVPA